MKLHFINLLLRCHCSHKFDIVLFLDQIRQNMFCRLFVYLFIIFFGGGGGGVCVVGVGVAYMKIIFYTPIKNFGCKIQIPVKKTSILRCFMNFFPLTLMFPLSNSEKISLTRPKLRRGYF